MIRKLYCCLVNWNSKALTIDCVSSLLEAGAALDRIIVVDNASTDGSSKALRRTFGERLQLIISDENLGFAQGSNLAITRALAHDASWVFVLNNDTVVAPTIFDEFASVVSAREEFSILAPLILYHDLPDQIWRLGDRLIPGTLMTRSLYSGRKVTEVPHQVVEVDFVSGAGMLIRRDVFETIGLFDSAYFMYGEEVDFCWRARSAGYRLACAPLARMWHKVSSSAERDPITTRYMKIRNQIQFYRRYASPAQSLIMFAFTLSRAIVLAVRDVLGGHAHLVLPLAQAWTDGWFRTGRPSKGYSQ